MYYLMTDKTLSGNTRKSISSNNQKQTVYFDRVCDKFVDDFSYDLIKVTDGKDLIARGFNSPELASVN
jgi:hypothetical protein